VIVDKAPARMARARTLAGLTVAQASRHLGIISSRLEDIEAGVTEPEDPEVRAMHEVYGADEAWLRGAPAVVPESVTKMLREADISAHDRNAIEEFAGMLGARTAKPAVAEPMVVAAVGESIAAKRRYVQRQSQTRKHHCHWPGCETQVPPAVWGCKPHWFRLPKALRDRIWRTYQPGQEVDMTPSTAYLDVADEVQAWIRESGGAP
jgi:transcriptional regulator with XRE-family HTH domain